MTPERFAALAAAYGGSIDRWPEAERRAARAYLADHPEAGTMLDVEATLDSSLALWTVPGPGAALAGRIAASATKGGKTVLRVPLWLAGIGLAGALAGGGVIGGLVAARLVPASPTACTQSFTVLGAPVDACDATNRSDQL